MGRLVWALKRHDFESRFFGSGSKKSRPNRGRFLQRNPQYVGAPETLDSIR